MILECWKKTGNEGKIDVPLVLFQAALLLVLLLLFVCQGMMCGTLFDPGAGGSWGGGWTAGRSTPTFWESSTVFTVNDRVCERLEAIKKRTSNFNVKCLPAQQQQAQVSGEKAVCGTNNNNNRDNVYITVETKWLKDQQQNNNRSSLFTRKTIILVRRKRTALSALKQKRHVNFHFHSTPPTPPPPPASHQGQTQS